MINSMKNERQAGIENSVDLALAHKNNFHNRNKLRSQLVVKMESRTPEREPMEASDEELLRAYRDGDPAGFDALLERHKGSVYAIIRGVVRDRDIAEDVFQEVFLKVIRASDTFDDRRRFAPWLFKIAVNAGRDALKSAAVRRVDASVELAEAAATAPATGEPERQAIASERRAAVAAALLQLPEPQRQVILLREFSGFSFEEIARMCNRPLNTVLSLMHRGLKRLRQTWPEGRTL